MKFTALPVEHGWVSARRTYCGGWMAVCEFSSQHEAEKHAANLEGEYRAAEAARASNPPLAATVQRGQRERFYGPEYGDFAD